ncbi:hypothetical protein GOV07_01355 [Candidatus Woesearchaeota archaeon]|nr:hypothetical protein [Candidatus Woesearchaeota archaeon]
MENILVDIGIIIIVATIGGYIAKMLKQPLIPVYILMGVLLGPILGLITEPENVLLLSEIGVAFLLFIVGLELDLRKLKDVGDVATIGGALQAFAMFGIGFVVARLLGFATLTSIYLGIVVSFSSTMVIIKMLSDKNELDTLHGRIVIGVLLLQDILAILALSMLHSADGGGISTILLNLLIGSVIIVLSFLVGKFLFPPIFRSAAKSLELLFLLSVSTCFFFALLFTLFGFSIAVGAFIAGVILGNLPYNIEIISRVKPLRDFFTVLFFASIGLQFTITGLSSSLWAILAFLGLTLFVSPILTMIVVGLFGYKRRASFLTGLNLSQISEFALIIALAGLSAGHISSEVFSLILALTIISIAASAYFIKYEDKIYAIIGPLLGPLERLSKVNRELENMSEESRHDVVLIGYDRTGYSIFRSLRRLKKDFVVVDFDPDVIRHLLDRNVPCIYGDIGDPEVMEKLRLHQVNMVISTVPNHHQTLALLNMLKKEHSHARVIVTSYQADEALDLYDAGADYVIIPHFLGGEHVSYMLEDISTNLDKLITTKLDHIEELKTRENMRPKKHKK